MPSESGDQDAPGQLHTSENTVHSADYAQATSPGPNDASSKEYLNGDAQQPGSNPPTPPATGQDEKTRGRKTSRAAEPFDESEREEMERMLQELCGHLGNTFSIYARHHVDAVYNQFSTRLVSWKEKMSLITSCSTPIGMSHQIPSRWGARAHA